MPDTRHPIWELSLVRWREFFRQPEAVFWTFGFPIVLTLALGIAFRNTGPEKVLVGVENNGSQSSAVLNALNNAPDVKATLVSSEDAARTLRSGKITIAVRAEPDGTLSYKYDPTRPESRVARLAVDDALQRHAG